MRVAAIDIGTNSVLLLVAEQQDGALVAVAERATITRLGQGVDRARALAPEAVERTLACLSIYAEEIELYEASRVDVVGTSAMRDAEGGEEFRERAKALLGVEPRVITGEDEARLTFEGALSGLVVPPGPALVFDVGGGSTEIIFGDASGVVQRAESLDVGSVRLTERHLQSDPPSADELEAVRRDARAALATLGPFPAELRGAPLVGVAGTVTSLAAFALDIHPYDGGRVHGAAVTHAHLEASFRCLAELSTADRKRLRTLDPGRADVIVAGLAIVGEIVAWASAGAAAGQETALLASDRGVRWGLAKRLAAA